MSVSVTLLMDLNSWGRSPGSPGPGRPADSALATVITDHHSTYVIGEYIAPDPDPVYPPIWDDDDDYVPIMPPSVTVNTDGEDMTVAVVACAAVGVLAALMLTLVWTTRKR